MKNNEDSCLFCGGQLEPMMPIWGSDYDIPRKYTIKDINAETKSILWELALRKDIKMVVTKAHGMVCEVSFNDKQDEVVSYIWNYWTCPALAKMVKLFNQYRKERK